MCGQRVRDPTEVSELMLKIKGSDTMKQLDQCLTERSDQKPDPGHLRLLDLAGPFQLVSRSLMQL